MNAFEEDLTLYRAIEREDCQMKDKKAFVYGEITLEDASVTRTRSKKSEKSEPEVEQGAGTN